MVQLKKFQNETTKINRLFFIDNISINLGFSFFNIKIATYSFGPVTIAFLSFFGAIPVLLLCYFKKLRLRLSPKTGIGLQ